MLLDFNQARDLLQGFEFRKLFIEQLGWSNPAHRRPETIQLEGVDYKKQQIAELGGVVVYEITAAHGQIPSKKICEEIHKHIAQQAAEHLCIFIGLNGEKRIQSLWYWVKREGNKEYARDHLFVKGQPGDLFLGKLSALVIDITELEEGQPSVVAVVQRLQKSLDIEKVTKKFFNEFKEQHLSFLELIEGITLESDRRWYASVILNRLMFIYFLQRKGFIDGGNLNYLQDKLTQSKVRGKNKFYSEFLQVLFFEGFAKPDAARSVNARQLIGQVKYLNGGLFLKHKIELKYPNIAIPDLGFENLLKLFERYSWNLNDTPGGKDDEINPDVLGYIFEKYINQKEFGAYYTRPEITEYLCERTIHHLILKKVNVALDSTRSIESMADLIFKLDADLCHILYYDILPSLSLLDPACGSGAFLVAAMKTLQNIYAAVLGKVEMLNDRGLMEELRKIRQEHSLHYYIKKKIITHNLYGVDIMEEATEIAKLRLFLTLVSSATKLEELEPLPNIDFNILPGNSLIGLMQVDQAEFDEFGQGQKNLFRKSYTQLLEEKNRLTETYRHAATYGEDLQDLRRQIELSKAEALETLDKILLEQFKHLEIKYEEAQLTGKAKKRSCRLADIKQLEPFHWGYEFDEIIHQRGGFDAIITNPPWEIFKPQAKEFFAEYSELVTKNKMDIKQFEKEQAVLLKNPEIAKAWIEYQSRFPHVSAFYRSAPQYKNQISVVNGKKSGTDINLYKLFTEQCFNLLRKGGECGTVIPSGIYTDLGTKQLREMLFSQTKVTGLFCFENRKEIFEGVHRSFKFVILTFEKGGTTQNFPTAFMRHEVKELERFPNRDSLEINVDLIRRLSPDSLSIMEFKNELDVQIAKKMLKFPLLGEKIDGKWSIVLMREFDRGVDNKLFKTLPSAKSLPLLSGKSFHQFTMTNEKNDFWIDEFIGRAKLSINKEQKFDYQTYRWVHRRIARNTDSRTLITTLCPKRVFLDNNSTTIDLGKSCISTLEMILLCGITNSFSLDWVIRQMVTTTLNMFYIYQLPVPRLTKDDPYFNKIVTRAAKLICTTPEFDDLAQEVGLDSHLNGVTDPVDRAVLRAELDGIIAHLYGLTEDEFSYILTTFPLVPDPTKQAALNAYRDVERGLIR